MNEKLDRICGAVVESFLRLLGIHLPFEYIDVWYKYLIEW